MSFIESLMNKLSYSKKMILIAIVFLIPITVLTTIVIKAGNAGIESSRIEQQGLSYIKTVVKLYKDVPQHRGMTNGYLNGKTEFKDKIFAKREEISAHIAAIDNLNTIYGEQFRTNDLWMKIKSEWIEITEQAFLLAPQEVFDKHTILILKIAELFEQISHYSGLSLDSNLDSARIISILTTKLPVITERLGRARGLGSGIAASGMITLNGSIKLETLVTEIRLNSNSVNKNLSAVMADNDYVKNALSQKLLETTETTERFLKTVHDEILNPQIIQIDSEKFFELGTDAIKSNFQLYDALIPELNALIEQRITKANTQRNFIIFIIAVTLLITTILFLGFFKSVVNNISKLRDATTSVASGDLRVKVKTDAQDETAQIVNALNQMVTKLNDTIAQIGTTSSMLSSSAGQLSETSTSVSTNISQQQMQTEQIAAAMNEMTATVKDIARNAELLAAEVSNAEDEITSGSTVINETISSINTLAVGVGNAANVVSDLEASSNEIGSILNVIKGVAEQTNLLALNAAIEAARAGEHGRGFAVVADEVRTLATRTQQSAEQIQDMVKTLQTNTRHATNVMNDEKTKAEQMSINTQAATTSLKNIVNSMSKISDMSTHVATAAEEQGSVSEEVNRNVNVVSELSSQNMNGTYEVSQATQALADLANQLDKIVKNFKV